MSQPAIDKSVIGTRAVQMARGQPLPGFAEEFLRIRTKKGEIVPFKFNKPQMIVDAIANRQRQATGKVRIIVLKARQEGVSTYIQGRFYAQTSGNFGKQAYILTHEEKATNNLFEMTKRFHANMDPRFRPHTKKSNAKELVFDRLDSAYAVGTAKTGSSGRSFTVQYFHGSEVAFWGDAEGIATGVLQAVGEVVGSEIWLESTARGMNNYFYRLCARSRKKLNEFEFVFLPWFIMAEYTADVREDLDLSAYDEEYQEIHDLTIGQMQWRTNKIEQFGGDEAALVRFQQEYPATPEEAFTRDESGSLIKAHVVMKARQATDIEPYGPRIWGVDPAWLGNDRFRVYERQGRVAHKVGGWKKLDTVQSASRILAMCERLGAPDYLNIDYIGFGAGVYDILRHSQIGHIVHLVNAGWAADDPERYFNKRAEMGGRCAQWLEEMPQVSIDDDDELQADLTCVRTKPDTKYRVKLESKDDIRKRGEPSPDNFEALQLTFAFMVGIPTVKHNQPDPNRPVNWRII